MTPGPPTEPVDSVALVVIGDEVLSGKFAEENFRYAVQAFRQRGVPLRRVVVIPDDEADIAATVADCSRRASLVVTSGGVGPTHDDRTPAGVARAFGVPLLLHAGLIRVLEQLRQPLPAGLLRMAHLPSGAEVLGSTPRDWMVRCGNVYMLPGVPRLFRERLDTLLQSLRGRVRFEGRVYVRVPEALFAEQLALVAGRHPAVAVGSYPMLDEPDFKVCVTVEAAECAAAEAAWRAVRELFGDEQVFRVDPPVASLQAVRAAGATPDCQAASR